MMNLVKKWLFYWLTLSLLKGFLVFNQKSFYLSLGWQNMFHLLFVVKKQFLIDCSANYICKRKADSAKCLVRTLRLQRTTVSRAVSVATSTTEPHCGFNLSQTKRQHDGFSVKWEKTLRCLHLVRNAYILLWHCNAVVFSVMNDSYLNLSFILSLLRTHS